MFEIKYYSLKEISKLQKDWTCLQDGPDMTYFQRYEWNVNFAKFNGNVKGKNHEAFFAVVTNCGKVELIAPLWIVKNDFNHYKRGIYFLGRKSFSDYLNFIYDSFDADAVVFLLKDVSNRCKIYNCYFEELPEQSKLYQFIKESKAIVSEENSICVHINVKDSVDEFWGAFSKSARQNIRTARNRAIKDNVSFVFSSEDKSLTWKEFDMFRTQRHIEKGYIDKLSFKVKLKNVIKQVFFSNRYFKFKNWTPYKSDKNSKFISLRDGNGELCAAFNYGIDEKKRLIVVMAVCTNPKFYKYSPGILTMCYFIEEQIRDKKYDIIDFTRGNEPYKYLLGGEEHFNKILTVNVLDL